MKTKQTSLDIPAETVPSRPRDRFKNFPKGFFRDPEFVAKLRETRAPIVIPYDCHRGMREAQGYLDASDDFHVFSCNSCYGCSLDCQYCYCPRMLVFKHCGTGIDTWGKFVFVKRNFPAMVEKDLRRLERKDILEKSIVRISSTTDVYQPAEREHKVLRRAIPKFIERPPGWIFLQTKSTLILRDLDLWENIKDRLIISITMTTDDNRTGRLFEPNAPLNSERLAVIKRLHGRGFHVEAMIAPILPQDPDHLATLLKPFVTRVFIKGFGAKDKKRDYTRANAKKIIFDNDMTRILTPEYSKETHEAFSRVLGPNRVFHGQDGFLDTRLYQ